MLLSVQLLMSWRWASFALPALAVSVGNTEWSEGGLPEDCEDSGLRLLQRHQERSQSKSPYWCRYISENYRNLVPLCWFGEPGPEPEDVPAGYPSWCKHVPEAIRFAVPPCDAETSEAVSGAVSSVSDAVAGAVSGAAGAVSGAVSGASNSSSGLVNPTLNEVKAERYSKLKEDSPYWCGYISDVVQYLVPPCWFGTPDAEPADLPGRYPTWCKHVPSSAREFVTPCTNQTATTQD